MEIITHTRETLSRDNIDAIQTIGAHAFGTRQGFSGALQHRVDNASHIQLALDNDRVAGFAVYEQHPESTLLAARGIDTPYQNQGLGTRMLVSHLDTHQDVDTINTFTRNPAIMRMIGKACRLLTIGSVEYRKAIATLNLEHTYIGDAAYHVNRYPGEGIYDQHHDPAYIPDADGQTFSEKYPPLSDIHNAILLVGKRHTGGEL